MYEVLTNFILAGGLNALQDSVIQNYIGPVFLIILAGVAIKMFMAQQVRQAITVIIFAAIAAVLIYAGPALFGESGKLKNAANQVIQDVNTITVYQLKNIPNIFR